MAQMYENKNISVTPSTSEVLGLNLANTVLPKIIVSS